jgi:hypothetical protein
MDGWNINVTVTNILRATISRISQIYGIESRRNNDSHHDNCRLLVGIVEE